MLFLWAQITLQGIKFKEFTLANLFHPSSCWKQRLLIIICIITFNGNTSTFVVKCFITRLSDILGLWAESYCYTHWKVSEYNSYTHLSVWNECVIFAALKLEMYMHISCSECPTDFTNWKVVQFFVFWKLSAFGIYVLYVQLAQQTCSSHMCVPINNKSILKTYQPPPPPPPPPRYPNSFTGCVLCHIGGGINCMHQHNASKM